MLFLARTIWRGLVVLSPAWWIALGEGSVPSCFNTLAEARWEDALCSMGEGLYRAGSAVWVETKAGAIWSVQSGRAGLIELVRQRSWWRALGITFLWPCISLLNIYMRTWPLPVFGLHWDRIGHVIIGVWAVTARRRWYDAATLPGPGSASGWTSMKARVTRVRDGAWYTLGVAGRRIKHQGPAVGVLVFAVIWPGCLGFLVYGCLWSGLGTWLNSDWGRRGMAGFLLLGIGKALCRGLAKAAYTYLRVVASVWCSVPVMPSEHRNAAGGDASQVCGNSVWQGDDHKCETNYQRRRKVGLRLSTLGNVLCWGYVIAVFAYDCLAKSGWRFKHGISSHPDDIVNKGTWRSCRNRMGGHAEEEPNCWFTRSMKI